MRVRMEGAPKPQDPESRRRELLTVAAAAFLTSAGVLLLIVWVVGSRAAPPASHPPDEAKVAAADSDSELLPRSAPTPKWVGSKRASWAHDGSKTIAFELQADNDVPVWMTRRMPVLVVRCLSRRTDVFVVTGSTSFESKANSHTVSVWFDDGAEMVQEWSGSESSQELFAPDGVAFARRLGRARTMRFGFTPFNASPVVASFHVGGFDQLVGLVATTCGWRVDNVDAQENKRQRSSRQATDN